MSSANQNPLTNFIGTTNLLGNLEFLNNLNNCDRNAPLGQQQQPSQLQHHHFVLDQQQHPVEHPANSNKLDVFAQLQQLVTGGGANNDTNSNQQPPKQQQQTTPTQHHKMISREKKKFSADVSDFLVLEVLKRKELLVENNTSRDLSFSESKRNAWNDVRALLMSRFPGFDLNIEAIKSHWRYRKRKVTDVCSELMSGAKGNDAEMKLKTRLPSADFEIYRQLKDSNLLSDGTGDEMPHYESISASVSPTMAPTQLMMAQPALLFPKAADNPPMNGHFGPFSMGQQQIGGGANPAILLERLTASLLEQQLIRQQQQDGGGRVITDQDQQEEAERQRDMDGHDQQNNDRNGRHGLFHDGTSRRSHSASTTTTTSTTVAEGNGQNGREDEEGQLQEEEEDRKEGPMRKRAKRENGGVQQQQKGEEEGVMDITEDEEGRCRRGAFIAQRMAFEEIHALATDVRNVLLPQLLTALHNYNSQFQSSHNH